MDDKSKKDGHIEGEGSYSGTKSYNEATAKFLKKGKVDEAAQRGKARARFQGSRRAEGGGSQGPLRRSQDVGEEPEPSEIGHKFRQLASAWVVWRSWQPSPIRADAWSAARSPAAASPIAVCWRRWRRCRARPSCLRPCRSSPTRIRRCRSRKARPCRSPTSWRAWPRPPTSVRLIACSRSAPAQATPPPCWVSWPAASSPSSAIPPWPISRAPVCVSSVTTMSRCARATARWAGPSRRRSTRSLPLPAARACPIPGAPSSPSTAGW